MSTDVEKAKGPWWRRTWFHWVVAIAVLAVLIGLSIVVWHKPLVNATAQTKAQELYNKAKAQGFRMPPEKETLEDFKNLYGTDGGATADTAESDISRALMSLNIDRSGEVNQRPGIIDRRLLEFEWLVLQVYRPDEAAKYQKYVDSLKNENTLGK
jgi:hypothetical protein